MIITTCSKNKTLLGDNNKALNKRLLSTINLTNSVLMIDLSYYSVLVDNKIKYNSSFGQKWSAVVEAKGGPLTLSVINAVFEPLLKLKRLINYKEIVVLCNKPSNQSNTEKELFKLLTAFTKSFVVCDKTTIVSTLYSIAIDKKDTYVILSDNIEFWSICSKISNIHHAVIVKNNNIKFYSEKFGLEYLSGLIGTNKLVNKLRLSKLKYVNLQYLFILLLYTKFKHAKVGQDLDISGKEYLGASGKALKILSESHKEISYYFLTKSDIMDIFLTSSVTHFILNLSRLLKVKPYDLNLMSGFGNFYNKNSVKYLSVKKIPVKACLYKLAERSNLFKYQPVTSTTPTPKNNSKIPLPVSVNEVDISSMETEAAVSAILRGLSW